MAKDHSFDIVSEVNLQEVTNAVEQARKEIAQRFDFKDSQSRIDWNLAEKSVTIHTESDFRLKSVTDILQTKFAKRGVSVRSMDPQAVERATGGTVRQVIKIQQGIVIEKAREIVRFIKDTKLKLQPTIQENQVRVQSAKIDALQELIGILRGHDFGIDLQFINYR